MVGDRVGASRAAAGGAMRGRGVGREEKERGTGGGR
jgi:hypothetical protein